MIHIEKARRRLTCSPQDFTCEIWLGAHPEGHKRAEGDGRTPEGEYRICTIRKNSKYHIALGLNYPRARDARAARREKRIGAWDCARICIADALHARPPWRTPLGGFIMLHGESPDGKTGDWTAGCVAMKNEDIEHLARVCRKGERVHITE